MTERAYCGLASAAVPPQSLRMLAQQRAGRVQSALLELQVFGLGSDPQCFCSHSVGKGQSHEMGDEICNPSSGSGSCFPVTALYLGRRTIRSGELVIYHLPPFRANFFLIWTPESYFSVTVQSLSFVQLFVTL